MKLALASPPFPASLADGIVWAGNAMAEATEAGAEIICFPESYLPGYPGMACPAEDRSAPALTAALDRICSLAARYGIAVVMPMDWFQPEGILNVAFVISAAGIVLGYQSKNQLDPSEETFWIPGKQRQLFEINGVKFGISICHEGFRYPETVRWAARRGAALVFHPQFTGSQTSGPVLTEWGAKTNPYYEKASMLRAMENTIYIATSNFASPYTESATAVIAPDGTCVAHEQYGRAGVLIVDIDPLQGTGILAGRLREELYYPEK